MLIDMCCCASNMRHRLLLISCICLSTLFANIILVHLTVHKLIIIIDINNDSVIIDRERRSIQSAMIIDDDDQSIYRRISNKNDDGVPVVSGSFDQDDDDQVMINNETDHNSSQSNEKSTSPTIISDDYLTTRPTTYIFSRRVDDISTTTTTPINSQISTVSDDLLQFDQQSTINKTINIDDQTLTSLSLIYSTTALIGIGSLIGYLPMYWILGRIGTRRLFPLIGLMTAASTAVMIPLAAVIAPSDHAIIIIIIIVLRFVQGVCLSGSIPILVSITAQWSPLKDQLFYYVLMLTSLVSTGSLIAILLSTCNIAFAYYSIALITSITFIIWYCDYRDLPYQHRCIDGVELNVILAGKSSIVNNRRRPSTIALIANIRAWSVWMCAFVHIQFILWLILSTPPSYYYPNMTIIIGLSLHLVGVLIAYHIMRRRRHLSSDDRCKIRLMHSFATITSSALLLCSLLFTTTTTFVYIGCFISESFAAPAYMQYAIMIGRQYSRYIIDHIQLSISIALIVSSLTVPSSSSIFIMVVSLLSANVLMLIICALSIDDKTADDSAAYHQYASHRMKTIDLINFNEECGLFQLNILSPSTT